MRCRKARWFLSARCDGTLSERHRERLNVHLEGCSDCRREAFYFSEITAAAGRLESVSVRPDFDLRLRAAIQRAASDTAAPARWRRWVPALRFRPVFAFATVGVCMLIGLGAFQYSTFTAGRDAITDQAQRAEEARLARDAALGLPTARAIVPTGWTPVDGLSPEMRRIQEQYLVNRNLPRRYIMETEGLYDPLSEKPLPQYVMPTLPSEQVVKQVSY